MREGERDVVQSNAPKRSTHSLTCQINLLRDDAAGRARSSDGRGGGWSVGARRSKQAWSKQAAPASARARTFSFISNISFIRKGKEASLGCTSSYFHTKRSHITQNEKVWLLPDLKPTEKKRTFPVVAKRQSYWAAFSASFDRFLKESRTFRG